jgi:threonine/homoserine/homoserine lactone efflux protein
MLLAAVLGFAFGFVGSIPVAGPIAALVVTRGIQGRYRDGAYISLGGGIAEAVYAFLAFWGFATYLTDYPIVIPISRAVAAVILMVLAVVFFRWQPSQAPSAEPPRDSPFGSFMLGASICALNPTLIATWSGVVTTLYSTELIDFQGRQALPFALGVALGIASWFGTLLGLIRRYRARFSQLMLARMVRVIGVLLLALALWFAWRFIAYVAGS